ncbi:hypothetical protein LTR10_019531 [Elasticomyces elasticus]|uniref:Transcription factor domain-containing protein n=1 Tax=Exophiala sideris TaxID=1016849 RepID=A0ABR0J5F5_9EURO|nr:hypothetical protein LTR10_019531 [Elasticomyces elasticus]KAK5028496.1 hypothetical protein LTS07_006587 [Exophiala sideris]KAK5035862.1 hypothetical protein LTR13_005432 [Exophiala sideris]KAK5056898.1 hypothetical protein LTR69_007536 [Exophiala sideris]KAK5181305.1 hypothetical protein LTR44_006100 [Eurotiomycetes sp. CCFEE 6388]
MTVTDIAKTSYLHSLQQKKQHLELKLHEARTTEVVDYGVHSQPSYEQAYHLSLPDAEDILSPSKTAYLGAGNSARFLDRLLKTAVQWHIARGIPIPRCLLPDEMSFSSVVPRTTTPSFMTTYDQRRLELYSYVPPSTQRAMIEHYLNTVSLEYPLLSGEQDSSLLVHENPLRWSSSNKENPMASALSIVFAVASSLITRDLDSQMSAISLRCIDEVQRISEGRVSTGDALTTTGLKFTALCALALCEMINPGSGQLWSILGQAISTIEDLRQGYRLRTMDSDGDFRRWQFSILKLESSAVQYFRRPSPFCTMYLRTVLDDSFTTNAMSAELYTLSHLQKLMDIPTSLELSEGTLENLIPVTLQVSSVNSGMSVQSATLYIALHPPITRLALFDPRAVNGLPSRLLQIVAKSASTLIDHFARLNEGNKIISIFMASEKVLEAGLVWSTYLLSHQAAITAGYQLPSRMSTKVMMSPIMRVSALLASFAGRWKHGPAYVRAWEALVELLWNII